MDSSGDNQSSPSMMESVSVQRPGEIDPRFVEQMNKKELKAQSNDPGWKYCFWPDPSNKNRVQCALCGHVTNGGIKRQKEHLIGGYRDVVKCPKTTVAISREMDEFKNRNKKRKMDVDYNHSDHASNNMLGTDGANVVLLDDDNTGAAGGGRNTGSGSGSGNRPPIPRYPGGKGPMDTFTSPSPWEVVAQRKAAKACGEPTQKTIESAMKKEAFQVANDCVAEFFYTSGIPFNAAQRESFEVMVESIIQAGRGYIPPSYHQLRKPLLTRTYERTKELEQVHEKHWKTYGCTIMCDGWTDRRQRSLINFLVNTPEGTFFLYARDATSDVHTGDFLFSLIDEAVERVGEDNVVQVVTDNAANFALAASLLMEKRKRLFWTPCAAHCIDLMLEDISKLEAYVGVIKTTRKITSFIYQHLRLHGEFIHMSEGHQELARSGVTRFATNFLALHSALKHRKTLCQLFISEFWTTSSWAKTADGKFVYEKVLANAFWEKVEDYLRAVQPLVMVLRLVDADEKPPMGYIAQAFNMAKEKIKENFGGQERQYKPVLEIVDHRWDRQMKRPLYGAGMFLNPTLYYSLKETNEAMIGEYEEQFIECLERMVPDTDEQDQISMELEMYKGARGLFGKDIAVRQRSKKTPMEWWDSYASSAPSLKKIAKRILGLCCTSSGCERNWSAFEFIHTKRRNRLEVANLEKIVYVQYNKQLEERFRRRRLGNVEADFDPIALDTLDWSSEWMTGMYVPPEVVPGISLRLLDEATGASDIYDARRPRRVSSQPQVDQPSTSRPRGRGRGRGRGRTPSTSRGRAQGIARVQPIPETEEDWEELEADDLEEEAALGDDHDTLGPEAYISIRHNDYLDD